MLTIVIELFWPKEGTHRITKTLKEQKLIQNVLLKLGKDKKNCIQLNLAIIFGSQTKEKKTFWHLKWTGQRNDLISFFSEFFKEKKKF